MINSKKALASAVDASSSPKKLESVPAAGAVSVAVFATVHPAPSSVASGIVTVIGTVIEPPAAIAAPGMLQVSGGATAQAQGAGGAAAVAPAETSSVNVTSPANGAGPSLVISIA
jgi:hypothetical protein